MSQYFLHFGTGSEPRLTVEVESKETATPKHKPSASGYCGKIPTRIMVKYEGVWRRVYAMVYGNGQSLFVNILGREINVQEY